VESPGLISLRFALHYLKRAQAIAQAARGLTLRADAVPPSELDTAIDLLARSATLAEREVRRRALAEEVANTPDEEGKPDDA
jgi:hypothetical protein